MARIPLIGGAYSARSVIASAQRSVNLYSEQNPQGLDAPVTQYPRPGLVLLATAPNGAGYRGLYTATNGQIYSVNGNKIYAISSIWAFTELGTITSNSGPVGMKDNAANVIVVDGTANNGWSITLGSNAFAQIADPDFLGGVRVDYCDTFFLLPNPAPNSRQFYSSLANSISFDALDFASKTGYPDPLVTLLVANRKVWLIGQQRSELWYNAGGAGFPFSSSPGVYMDVGCAAPYSIASHNEFLFWLARSAEGVSQVVMGAQSTAARISNFALEEAIASYAVSSRIDDAVGMTFEMNGHIFYMLTFPAADKTWVYDKRTEQWHEECWLDSNGAEHRHRANCTSFGNSTNICGDWQNGNLYKFDMSCYTDNLAPIIYRRGFPSFTPEGKRASYGRFQAEFDTGKCLDATLAPKVYLRWSDDYGFSFGNPLEQSLGVTGKTKVAPTWNRCGQARFRVFELFWSSAVKTALNGAFVFSPVPSDT